MINYLNEFFGVLKLYVNWLFTLFLTDGVSLGSIFLVASIFWVISIIWPRS